MSKYMIHACPSRMWYVRKYLIPSMTKQNIPKDDIVVFNDTQHLGNLRACIESFKQLPDKGGTWHIQDDVLICHDFKERTEQHERNTIVCGFSCQKYDGIGSIGTVNLKGLWYSFPCIYIPNVIAKACAKWIEEDLLGNAVYAQYWKDGNNDDWAFRLYLNTFHKDLIGYNIKPNLVEHIDYLIGGTTLNKENRECKAQYFVDTYLVDELMLQLKRDKKCRYGH